MLPRSGLLLADSKSNSSTRLPLSTTTRVSSGWEASMIILFAMKNSLAAPIGSAPRPMRPPDQAERFGRVGDGKETKTWNRPDDVAQRRPVGHRLSERPPAGDHRGQRAGEVGSEHSQPCIEAIGPVAVAGACAPATSRPEPALQARMASSAPLAGATGETPEAGDQSCRLTASPALRAGDPQARHQRFRPGDARRRNDRLRRFGPIS